jgi:hypothetical protein
MTHNDYFVGIQRARDAYRATLGRDVDDSGLAEALRLQLDKGYSYDDLLIWLEQSDEYQSQQPPPPIDPPLHPAPPLPPIQGQLGVDGKGFQDDAGYRVPLFCHAGDLILLFVEGRLRGDTEVEHRVHAAFADLQAYGYSGLRSWWSISWAQPNAYWGNRRLNPSDDAHRRLIHECFRIGAEDYGLKWHTALGSAENVPVPEMDDAWHWMRDVVAGHPEWFALVEGLNEAYHTGESDPDEVARWVNKSRTRNPTVLHALSAAAGAAGSEELHELEKWTPDWQQFYMVHANRANQWGDQTRHAFSIGYEHPPRRLGWSGEPPGIQWDEFTRVSGMSHPEQWSERPWRYALYLAQTAMSRQMPTYMCSHGVCLEGRFRDAPGFTLAPRLIAALPPDVMAYDEIFHGGDTHKHRRVIEAPLHCRADHVKKATGECVITVYPERPEVQYADLVFDRAWQGRIYDEQGYLDCAVSRGERRSHDISGGLLLIGREL